MFAMSGFENITPHRANDIQHNITLFGVVMCLIVCLWVSVHEIWQTALNEIKEINYAEMSSRLTDIKHLHVYYRRLRS